MSKSSSKDGANATVKNITSKLKALALIMLVSFAIAPVVLSSIPGTSSNVAFSIYNEDYDGLSTVREKLESIEIGGNPKYDVTNIVSNLNILNRFNGSGALVIVGPASNYGVTETISLILYMLRGGSVIVVDDFGSGNQILDPIFDAFENLESFASKAEEQLGIPFPSITDIFQQGSENETQGAGGVDGITDVSFMTNLIGDLILRFGFNSTGILMDAGSNDGNPARAIIKDFDDNDIPGFTFTQGISQIGVEFASIISVKLRVNQIDPDTGKEVPTDVWQPLQKLTGSLINEEFGDDSFELSLPLFPIYSSKTSWIETDFEAAKNGEMTPDLDEWGNAKFALALTIPLFPDQGKLIFLSDPSIFINRYTQNPDYDNLQLITNMLEMATAHQVASAGSPIPILFDFGHTYQGITSPALYTTSLIKLIAELSMFPLYAPLVPLFAYGYGKRLMPKTRRLRPILLTKRRGERGKSDFEKHLEAINETGTYGEPIMHLKKRLVREVGRDVRFDGIIANDPAELARFFKLNFPERIGSERELRSQLSQVFRISKNEHRRMSRLAAKKYLILLKKLNDMVG